MFHCKYVCHSLTGTALNKLSAAEKNLGELTRILSGFPAFNFASVADQSNAGVFLLKSVSKNLLYVLYGSRISTRLICAAANCFSRLKIEVAFCFATASLSPANLKSVTMYVSKAP